MKFIIIGIFLFMQMQFTTECQESVNANQYKKFTPIIEANQIKLGVDGLKSSFYSIDKQMTTSFNTGIIGEYRLNFFVSFEVDVMGLFYFPSSDRVSVRSFNAINLTINQIWQEQNDLIFYTSLSQRYVSKTNFSDEILKNLNQTDITAYISYSIANLGNNGLRIFSKGGIGYYYDSKNIYPNLEIGISLGYGLKISLDLVSFLTTYDKNQLGSALIFKN